MDDGVTATQVVFWILAVVMLLSAVGVVTAGNIVYAALFFIASLAGVAGIYLILTVEFIARVQLLIYGSAVTAFGGLYSRRARGPDRRDCGDDLDHARVFCGD